MNLSKNLIQMLERPRTQVHSKPKKPNKLWYHVEILIYKQQGMPHGVSSTKVRIDSQQYAPEQKTKCAETKNSVPKPIKKYESKQS